MMPSAEPSFSDMLDGGCKWWNRSGLHGALMKWSPNTTGGSRFFITQAEYRVSALGGRDGYGSDAEYAAPSSQVAHSDFRNGSFTSFPLSRRVRFASDCVAKVASCRATNFRENPKQEAIADSYSLTRITEVACEFNVRR